MQVNLIPKHRESDDAQGSPVAADWGCYALFVCGVR